MYFPHLDANLLILNVSPFLVTNRQLTPRPTQLKAAELENVLKSLPSKEYKMQVMRPTALGKLRLPLKVIGAAIEVIVRAQS